MKTAAIMLLACSVTCSVASAQEQDRLNFLELPGVLPPQQEVHSRDETERQLRQELLKLIPDQEKIRRTQELVSQLNEPSFSIRNRAARKLAEMPDISVEVLLKASSSQDFEIRFRAQKLLNENHIRIRIQQREELAYRIIQLMNRNEASDSPKLLPLIFRVAPYMDSESLVEAAGELVSKLVQHRDLKNLVNYFLSDSPPVQRLAAYGIGKVGNENELKLLRQKLNESDAVTATTIALALLRRSDKSAIKPLILLMRHDDKSVRAKCTQILRAVTGVNKKFNPYLPPNSQQAILREWDQWLVVNSKSAKLITNFQLKALPEDLAQGLVMHYEFENREHENGNYFHFVDSTNKKQTGIAQNSVDWVSRGSGKAIRFHGAGKHGSRGGHATIAPIDFDQFKEFTVALWVKETGLTHEEGEAYITFGTDGGVGREESLGIVHFNGMIFYRSGDGEVATEYDQNDKGKWTHYAMTFRRGIISGYKNGKLMGKSPGKVNVKTTRAALARHWWGNGAGTSTRLQAAMDDVRVYKRCLDQDQIRFLYQDTADGS